jgi:hypothetical protein
MAALELRNQTCRVVFMYAGKRYGYSLDTGDRQTAEALRGGVEKTLMLIGRGALQVPEGADAVLFVKNGGKVVEPATPAPAPGRRELPTPGLGHLTRTTRNPWVLYRPRGGSLARAALRQFAGPPEGHQEPPRQTRSFPVSAPVGSTFGLEA